MPGGSDFPAQLSTAEANFPRGSAVHLPRSGGAAVEKMSQKKRKMPGFAARAIALFILLLIAAGSALAATATEFYVSLLRRGVASYEAGRFESAARELDVAAFGLLESIDHFETAKVYAALANDKLGRTAPARLAAQRVLAAERVQRRLAQIALPADVRAAFVALAQRLLPGPEAAALSSTGPVPAPALAQPRVTPSNPPPAAAQPPTSAPPAPAPQKPPTPQKSEPAPPQKDPAPQKAEPPRQSPAPKQVEPPKVIVERTVPFPPQPQAKTEEPRPQTSHSAPRPAPSEAASRLAAAERHLAANNLVDARVIYRQLIETSLDRASLLTIAEGSYRARDFVTTVRAFDRVGTIHKGEEPYRFYLAVALYETGDYMRAKEELSAALPFIEITESVTRYRAKIEGAPDSGDARVPPRAREARRSAAS